ncbi:hypothetical protein BESB_027220 [Besnoitia besnoiti]|uniref:F-box domain-containing protein n=1 Tax=Besnoitia besnoiti TaxID=94643 RepID=A0A2A9M6M8_BESBE|nr:uncharacterized protein BESB_027220 [Besnoitia besnoiti]PFH31287.1 hypothetical protein BESB_027220 [Besnoitia besnoiti]
MLHTCCDRRFVAQDDESPLHDTEALDPLGPEWWGYILAVYLPPSSIFTIKQVCKAWNALTTSRYYTIHSPLRITERILYRLSCETSTLTAEQRARVARHFSLHCGDSITIGVARDSEAIHDITQMLLLEMSPVKQMTISIDTTYMPIPKSLHSLLLRSVDALQELKLRGVRVSQQLNRICMENHQNSFQRLGYIELSRLQVLEVDDVSFLEHLSAPRLVSLFVDYTSLPESSEDLNHEANEAALGCGHTLSKTPRFILLTFLSRSGSQLERLVQAAILPEFSRSSSRTRNGSQSATVGEPFVCLPKLTSLAASDIHLLLHIRTLNLQSLTACVPSACALTFFKCHCTSQLKSLELTLEKKAADGNSRRNSWLPVGCVSPCTTRLPSQAPAFGGRGAYRHSSCPLPVSAYDWQHGRQSCNEPPACLYLYPKDRQGPTGNKESGVRDNRHHGLQRPLSPVDSQQHTKTDYPPGVKAREGLSQMQRTVVLVDVACQESAELLPILLPNLVKLTAPGCLLTYLFCPALERAHVTGQPHRTEVLSFVYEAAPKVEELILDTLARDRDDQGRARQSVTGSGAVRQDELQASKNGGRGGTIGTVHTNPVAPRWRLPKLRVYKGPVCLWGIDVECPKLECLTGNDAGSLTDLAPFLCSGNCPVLRELSVFELSSLHYLDISASPSGFNREHDCLSVITTPPDVASAGGELSPELEALRVKRFNVRQALESLGVNQPNQVPARGRNPLQRVLRQVRMLTVDEIEEGRGWLRPLLYSLPNLKRVALELLGSIT